jgi:hypothetical protein
MKGFLSVIAFVALIAMLLGMNVGGAAQMAVTPKPSQEVVNKIAEQKAKDEADALKAWHETWNGLIRVFKYGLAGTFLAGFAIVGTIVVQRVIRRNDRPLDENGHAPLVPAKADLANPNLTGALTSEPVDPQMALELAKLRAQVDMMRAAFAGGINGRMAGNMQRDLRPDPPGWDGTITAPPDEQHVGLDGFMLVDDKGNERQLGAGKLPEMAETPAMENFSWR